MKHTLNTSMFKAYDIRVPASELDPDQSRRLAEAEAVYFRDRLKTNEIVLARDARLSGPRYLQQAMEIFLDRGFEVLVNPHVSSTSLFYYTCMRNPDAAGVLYGASHNPGEYTGQKIVGPGVSPIAMDCGAAGGLKEIRGLFEQGARLSGRGAGKLRMMDRLEEYIEYSLNLAGVEKNGLSGCRLMIDFLNGAAGEEFMRALQFAGAKATPVNLIPDGAFPCGAPNPVVPESIRKGVETLRTGEFDLGIFLDGDGDRIDFVDPQGIQLSPGFNFALLAGELMRIEKSHAGDAEVRRVYADLKANPAALTMMAEHGLGVSTIRNGHSQIKEALRRNGGKGYFAAVEESSHYYMNFPLDGRVYPTENTLFYGLLTLKQWMREPERYERALEIQKRTYREREWGHRFPTDEQRRLALDAVEKRFVESGGQSMSAMSDGTELEATLMRKGLPLEIEEGTSLPEEWAQLAQRVSQSEPGLARWEALASREDLLTDTVKMIEETVAAFGAGPKYVG